MNKHIYEKMAVTNVWKNTKLYLPYLLTVIGSMMFFYILTSLGTNPHIFNLETGKECFYGAAQLCAVLQSSSFVISVFTFIFLLYANSFVLKHQKKQLGLYRVLGMERKHILRIMSTETLLIFIVGLLGAIFLGILFDKLMLVSLFRIIRQTSPEGFFLNTQALIQTLSLAAVIALLIFIRSTFSILTAKDVELLKSDKTGEKEPKSRILLAFAGVVFLAIGYLTALNTEGVSAAIENFFPAAFLVILATYALFTAGSITLLKLLKKNKKYYYTTRHFISVSGMLYRMKQNAAGLATICILSTAAIIVTSAGVALYTSGDRSINEQFPRMIQLSASPEHSDTLQKLVLDAAKKTNVTLSDTVTCNYGTSLYEFDGTELKIKENSSFTNFDANPDTFILTLEEYNRFNQTSVTLDKNEILVYTTDSLYNGSTIKINGISYKMKDTADKSCLTYTTDTSMTLFPKLLIVVPTPEDFQQFIVKDNALGSSVTYLGFNSTNSENEIDAFAKELTASLKNASIDYDLSLKHIEKNFFLSLYGGIFFVGIILGILFLISTAMIIYYKQISEGYDDKERFVIMQKVGLSKKEIRSSIHSQVMLVFFLPLVTAIIHACVALKIVASCLQMVVVVHMPTFLASIAMTSIAFSIIYIVIYKVTSREYYKIVNE